MAIFGKYDQTKPFEEKLALAAIGSAKVLCPGYGSMSSPNFEVQTFGDGQTHMGDYVVPFDFISHDVALRNTKTTNFDRIARPDMIGVQTHDDELLFVPYDVKAGERVSSNRQISGKNLAYLFSVSPYLQNVISYFESLGITKMHTGSGEFLCNANDEPTLTSAQVIDDFLSEGSLHCVTSSGAHTLMYDAQGGASSGLSSFDVRLLTAGMYSEEIAQIRNDGSRYGFVPYNITFIEGFLPDGSPNSTFRMTTDGSMKTWEPRIPKLLLKQQQVLNDPQRMYELAFQEQLQTGLRDTLEQRLKRLDNSLLRTESKQQRVMEKLQERQLREEELKGERNTDARYSVIEATSGRRRTKLMTKFSNLEHRRVETSKIRSTVIEELSAARRELFIERGHMYTHRDDIYAASEKIRDRTIAALDSEVKALEKKVNTRKSSNTRLSGKIKKRWGKGKLRTSKSAHEVFYIINEGNLVLKITEAPRRKLD